MFYDNLAPHELIEFAIKNNEGHLSKDGVFVVTTGEYTGRSPNAKFFVDDENTHDMIDWGKVNKPISAAEFKELADKMEHYIATNEDKDFFDQEVFVGADKNHRLSLRIITEFAWHSLFVTNMFITPTKDELKYFTDDFVIACLPGLQSESRILINITEKIVLITGTEYAGEIKKSAFTIMNYLLPAKDIIPMHCSVNVGENGSAVFFGLSGTGKTTLSADPNRKLVGDDEHGWGENGLFNFEGGCYAKVINLDPDAEPEIHNTCHRFGTILENVVMKKGIIDLNDGTLTQNTRGSYPLHFIPNIVESGMADHPTTVIMLTCDAFGVLPPLSHLSAEEAVYYFLSGYTAKVAGTERGLGDAPAAVFSTCFGAPFMPRHPSVYANLLKEMIEKYNVDCWLVNTGWTGGGYGKGKRISIKYTRQLINSALNFASEPFDIIKENTFGFMVPAHCTDVPDSLLLPRNTWNDVDEYDQVAEKLIADFRENFKQYEDFVDKENFRL